MQNPYLTGERRGGPLPLDGDEDGEKVGEIGSGAREDPDDAVREYEEKRDRCVAGRVPMTATSADAVYRDDSLAKAIEASLALIADLRNFNEREWTIRYPLVRPGSREATVTAGSSADAASSSASGKAVERSSARPAQPRRTVTLTFPDDPSATPHEISVSAALAPATVGSSATTSAPEISHIINSVSAIDEAAAQTGRQGAEHASRRALQRSVTLMPGEMRSHPALGGPEPARSQDGAPSESEDSSGDFSILRLDLSIGHQTVQSATAGLITSLNRSSISTLLSSRLTQSLAHLQLLQQRIASTSSRVLVTGDLNAGKSTLVNALLRRGDEVMPVDQQPLTGRFVEVFGDAEIGTLEGVQKGLREEVHVPRTDGVAGGADDDADDGRLEVVPEHGNSEARRRDKGKRKEVHYDRTNEETYDRKRLEDLYELVLDQEADNPPLKVYLRPPQDSRNPSILHNGILDISLIDAPGLNRDVLQTTSNFASSSSIDVIVFVVSAANHFTLSAKEFILSAGQEKARMFIVVNRFDEVRDKERCKRLVLEQIKRLSPGTYEDRDELVHFVDSAKVAYGCFSKGDSEGHPSDGGPSGSGGGGGGGGGDSGSEDDFDDAFKHLEQSLRSFVLINRAKSKLGPAETYLNHLLTDIDLLAGANAAVAQDERDATRNELAKIKPVLMAMQKGGDGLDVGLVEEEDRIARTVETEVADQLHNALSRISHGQLASEGGAQRLTMPGYPGLLGAWDYAAEVRRVMLQSVDLAVINAEGHVRALTAAGVTQVSKLGDQHLPKDIERSNRVFNADAMFARRETSKVPKRAQLLRRRSSNFGTVGLDLTLSGRPELLQVSFVDLIDMQHVFAAISPVKRIEDETAASAWGVASLAAGAVTVFGGQALGVKALLRNSASLFDILSDDSARRMVAPVIGAAVLGLALYVVNDLPTSIPKNVGRHLHLVLVSDMTFGESSGTFVDLQVGRMQREARKVIRVASWDLRERFRSALEARSKAVQEREEVQKKSEQALVWFRDTESRVGAIREQMESAA